MVIVFLALGAGVQAQDYIGYHIQKVETYLRAERVNYITRHTDDETQLILLENGDTAIWKFGKDSTCFEYILILRAEDYDDISGYLKFTSREVNKDVFVNMHDNTINYVSLGLNGLVVVVTRRYIPDEHFRRTEPIDMNVNRQVSSN